MNRKLQVLGLALVAALAMSAVAASAASASGEEKFHSAATHTILDASSIGTQSFVTTVDNLTCTGVSVSSATINSATTEEITATPSYTGCKAEGLGVNTHVKMNGCDYLFTSKKSGNHAPVHIRCSPTTNEILINATFLGAELGCVRVPEQTPTGGGVVYSNNGSHVNINATVTGIEYTEVSFCGSGQVANDGTYTGNVTVSGTDTNGNSVAISWT